MNSVAASAAVRLGLVSNKNKLPRAKSDSEKENKPKSKPRATALFARKKEVAEALPPKKKNPQPPSSDEEEEEEKDSATESSSASEASSDDSETEKNKKKKKRKRESKSKKQSSKKGKARKAENKKKNKKLKKQVQQRLKKETTTPHPPSHPHAPSSVVSDETFDWTCGTYKQMYSYRKSEFRDKIKKLEKKDRKVSKEDQKKIALLQAEEKQFHRDWISLMVKFATKHYEELVEHKEPHALSKFSMVWKLHQKSAYLKLVFLDKYSMVPFKEFDSELRIAKRLGDRGLAPRVIANGYYDNFFGWMETEAACCTIYHYRKDREKFPNIVLSDQDICERLTTLIKKIADQHVLLYDVKILNFVIDPDCTLKAIDFSGNWSFYRPYYTKAYLARCMYFFVWMIVTQNTSKVETLPDFPLPSDSLKFDENEVIGVKQMMENDELDVLLSNYCDEVPVEDMLQTYVRKAGHRKGK